MDDRVGADQGVARSTALVPTCHSTRSGCSAARLVEAGQHIGHFSRRRPVQHLMVTWETAP